MSEPSLDDMHGEGPFTTGPAQDIFVAEAAQPEAEPAPVDAADVAEAADGAHFLLAAETPPAAPSGPPGY